MLIRDAKIKSLFEDYDKLVKNEGELIYSKKRLSEIWEILVQFPDIFPTLEIPNFDDLKLLEFADKLKIIDSFRNHKTTANKLKKLFEIDQQVSLIHLRDMSLSVEDDGFKPINGVYICDETRTHYAKKLDYDHLSKEGMIKLEDAFQMMEDELNPKIRTRLTTMCA
jgi:hypothetical protein